jgi:hypothetical protein
VRAGAVGSEAEALEVTADRALGASQLGRKLNQTAPIPVVPAAVIGLEPIEPKLPRSRIAPSRYRSASRVPSAPPLCSSSRARSSKTGHGKQRARLALDVAGLRQGEALAHARPEPLVVRQAGAVSLGLRLEQGTCPERMPGSEPNQLAVFVGHKAVRAADMRRCERAVRAAAQMAPDAVFIGVMRQLAERREVWRSIFNAAEHGAES